MLNILYNNRGAFACVRLGVQRDSGCFYAIKSIIKKKWDAYQHSTTRKIQLMDEVELMKQAKHDHIVSVCLHFYI